MPEWRRGRRLHALFDLVASMAHQWVCEVAAWHGMQTGLQSIVRALHADCEAHALTGLGLRGRFGAALLRLSHLLRLVPVLDAAERLARLRLRPDKCVIVPIGKASFAEIGPEVRDFISTHVPRLRGFEVRPFATNVARQTASAICRTVVIHRSRDCGQDELAPAS